MIFFLRSLIPKSEKRKKKRPRAGRLASHFRQAPRSSSPLSLHGDARRVVPAPHAFRVAAYLLSIGVEAAPEAASGRACPNPDDGGANANADTAARRSGAPPGPLRRRGERRPETPLRLPRASSVPWGLRSCPGAVRAWTVCFCLFVSCFISSSLSSLVLSNFCHCLSPGRRPTGNHALTFPTRTQAFYKALEQVLRSKETVAARTLEESAHGAQGVLFVFTFPSDLLVLAVVSTSIVLFKRRELWTLALLAAILFGDLELERIEKQALNAIKGSKRRHFWRPAALYNTRGDLMSITLPTFARSLTKTY